MYTISKELYDKVINASDNIEQDISCVLLCVIRDLCRL